jgi:uncharacterized peroxidase-related enzyme
MTQGTRIPLLERDQVSHEVATLYDALLAQRGVVPNMFKTLANVPSVAIGIAGFLRSLLGDSAISGWYKELVATRVGFLNGCDYCVAAHRMSARQKGAPEEKIAAVTGDFESGPFMESEKLGLRCAEILHRSSQGVNDNFFGQLKATFSDGQIVELFTTIGAFEMFPRIIDGLRIPKTPPPPPAR